MGPWASFTDYINAVVGEQQKHPEWRVGQTFFNVLVKYQPAMAEQIRGGMIDPFYKDENVNMFLAFVDEHWEPAGD